ncbi:MAG: hydroxymethylbilane synthase [Acidimicrobiales bacterium]
MHSIRIATRRSPLAMWQSHHVAGLLRAQLADLEVEFVSLDTHADVRLDVPISDLGGKGAFSKEVQARVLAGQADLAVHSAKDLQALTPDGLVIAAVPERGNPLDVLVGGRLADLPAGSVVGTGSNRRRVQLAAARPDLVFQGLRGNIARRLAQLDEPGGPDAIVMAAAALERLDETPAVVDELDPAVMLPQVGQGALAVECRADDAAMRDLLATIEHGPSRRCLDIERGFLAELGGDCDLPAGAHATLAGDEVTLTGFLAAADERASARVSASTVDHPDAELGAVVARQVRAAL